MSFIKKLKKHWKAWYDTRLSIKKVQELSLYPDIPQKKLSRIRRELYWLCSNDKRGSWGISDTIEDYFNMGIDRAGQDLHQYYFRSELDTIRNLKQPLASNALRDKWLTSEHLSLHGVPTSRLILYKTPFMSVDEALEKLKSSGETRFFAKKVDGSLGVGAFSFRKEKDAYILDDGSILSGEALVDKLENYIVETYINQHEDLGKLYPHGVSSLRVVTVCDKDKIRVILATLLIGAGGASMSNFHQGGLRVQIDINTGELSEKGLRTKVKRGWYTAHPDTGVPFKGFRIPYWNEVIDLVIRGHKCFPIIHSIGWDVAISSSGPLIMEGNQRWVPHSFQFTYGPGRSYMNQFF